MRLVSRKLFGKISDKGMSKDDVLEFFDRLSPTERKKSFPDDCLFQKDRYFAEKVLGELVRSGLIIKKQGRYFKNEVKKDK